MCRTQKSDIGDFLVDFGEQFMETDTCYSKYPHQTGAHHTHIVNLLSHT